MPELPEVETIVRDLRRLVVGTRIGKAEVLRPDLIGGDPRTFEAALAGRRIEEIERRAKNIVFRLKGPQGRDHCLIVNLGMTGRVLVMSTRAEEPQHVGVRFDIDRGRRMLYQDVRRFGRLELLPAEDWHTRAAALGVEPLSDAFTPEHLFAISRRSKVAVKPWLMNQRWIVGVGNIYASESLFRARINPRKAARRLTRRQAAALYDGVRQVLLDAIEFRGTTLLDYRDASGERGTFSQRLRVYDRTGEPCLMCGSPIRRIVQSGRSTFYCPRCQRY